MPRPVLLALLALGLTLVTACQPAVHGNPRVPPGQSQVRAPDVPAGEVCERSRVKPGLRTVEVRSQGRDYDVSMYLPRDSDNANRVPLLLNLHGSSSNGRKQMRFSSLNRVAAREGFLVAAPNGAVRAEPGKQARYSWNVPGVPLFGGAAVPEGTRDDAQFLRDVIEQLTTTRCVDAARVYVAGFSGGARMASALACSDATRVTGIIAISGLRAGTAGTRGTRPAPGTCRPEEPVSVFAFHGTADKNAPYYGGGGREWGYSVPAALREWAERNRCEPEAERRTIGAAVRFSRYLGCAARDGAPTYVRLWAIRGGQHRWPDTDGSTGFASGRASQAPSVAEVVAKVLRERSA